MAVSPLSRWTTVVAAAFVGFTICWIGLGLRIRGDSFPNIAHPRLAFFFVLLPTGAAWIADRVPHRVARIAVALATVGALLFRTLVRDGWWAVEPPSQNADAAKSL